MEHANGVESPDRSPPTYSSDDSSLSLNGGELGADQEKTPELDWDFLKSRSLQPGGFGDDRAQLWPQLLNARLPPSPQSDKETHKDQDTTTKEESLDSTHPQVTTHPDEHQISLDTHRSFVLYPVEADTMTGKDKLQADLYDLLVSLFRKRPKLRYFQGYHDIVTVLFLTLPPEIQLNCAEKISLHRVRDSMGTGLEPVLGLLHVLKKLLRIADPEYAELLEQTAPLPFYALSNLLTLFSHDMPTLPLIQHVFDYLLCRPPIIVVYLATAIILCRQDEVRRLEEEGEDGMIHSLLSGLPNISDELYPEAAFDETKQAVPDPGNSEPSRPTPPASIDHRSEDDKELLDPVGTEQQQSETERIPPTGDDPETGPSDSPPLSGSLDGVTDPESTKTSTDASGGETNSAQPSISWAGDASETDDRDHHSPSPPPHTRRTSITLSSLLSSADALYAQYPPTLPNLCLSSIMGPQSVIFTWSEKPSHLPSDSMAESMVLHPELVVYPYQEDEPEYANGRSEKTESGSETEDGKQVSNRRAKDASRRAMMLRKLWILGQVEKRTMVAGAVLVVAIALAFYGIRTNGRGVGGNSPRVSPMRELHMQYLGLRDTLGDGRWRGLGFMGMFWDGWMNGRRQ
ncbi:hypothetical protein BDN72DRAFT_814675 [Pluteus cervinus]|uniref:Uncharacterized protein n=1 Tax=Pluteus cervinus TaxID=181527 RepID=A0ACD3B6Y2_9AGAR|nr:hypothetical protein BDN72DRAFT_814675 [Pluteus cervinus]